MIVVIGSPLHRPGAVGQPSSAAGTAAGIAVAAAAAGRAVQLVGRVGEDAAGEATLLALGRAGVGHVATLRDPSHPTTVVPGIADRADLDPSASDADAELAREAAGAELDDGQQPALVPGSTLDREDLELALRYLDGFGVIVVAEALGADALVVVAEAAAYTGAVSVVLVPAGGSAPDPPDQALVLEAPEVDPDGVFARTVGALAAALDSGTPPTEALAAIAAAQGWARAED